MDNSEESHVASDVKDLLLSLSAYSDELSFLTSDPNPPNPALVNNRLTRLMNSFTSSEVFITYASKFTFKAWILDTGF